MKPSTIPISNFVVNLLRYELDIACSITDAEIREFIIYNGLYYENLNELWNEWISK